MKKKQNKNNKDIQNVELNQRNQPLLSVQNAEDYEDYDEILDEEEYGEDVDFDLFYEENDAYRSSERCVELTANRLDTMFKLAAYSDDKQEIKQLRSDIWEFQMYIEDHDYCMNANDFIQMAHDILSINLEQLELHKEQILLAKEILAFTV